MKVVVLAPVVDSNPRLALHTAQLSAAVGQLGNDNLTIETITFSNGLSDSSLLIFDKHCLSDYQLAAELINTRFDVCLLQYASAAFGGNGGVNILNLVSQLKVPLITIVHKVENEPCRQEKAIMGFLAKRSERILTFSQLGVEFLEHYYKINRDKLLRHSIGITAFTPMMPEERTELIEADCSKLILACGEMTASSGFETIINALPVVQKSNHGTKLLIVNASTSGRLTDEYIKSLMRLAMQRGVLSSVKIIDWHSVGNNMERLMHSADVYVSACIEEKLLEDIYLSMAVNSGAAILSTPTWFASELLDEQKGNFFSFRSATELSSELMAMLRNKNEVQRYRENATLYGAQHTSDLVTKKLLELIYTVKGRPVEPIKSAFELAYLPELNLQHIQSLENNLGYLKQTLYGVADLGGGYCLRSNALALEVFTNAYMSVSDDVYLQGIKKCLSFIQLVLNDTKTASTANSYAGELKHQCSGLALGQTISSLGVLYASDVDAGIKDMAYGLLLDISQRVDFNEANALALGVIGLTKVLNTEHGHQEFEDLLKKWSAHLQGLFPADKIQNWQWHADELGSQLGLVPYALLCAYELLHDEALLTLAKRALRFVEKMVLAEDRFIPKVAGVAKGEAKAKASAEQNAIEGVWMVKAFAKLFVIADDARCLRKAWQVHSWYLGDNTIGKGLYDSQTGGCYSSLSGRSINPQMTLEATSAYWLSHYALCELYYAQLFAE